MKWTFADIVASVACGVGIAFIMGLYAAAFVKFYL